jgi:hypothetical protein
MQPETTQLEMPLRRALRRAGLVSGYRHKCWKQGCGYVVAATDGGIRTCPRHDHKLWVKAVVRPIRFHDLRHTTGSLTMRGANTRFAQRIMRHSDPRMTERYSRFDPDYLHSKLDELMRLQPANPKPDPEPAVATAAVAAPAPDPAALSTRFLPDAPEGASEADPSRAARLGGAPARVFYLFDHGRELREIVQEFDVSPGVVRDLCDRSRPADAGDRGGGPAVRAGDVDGDGTGTGGAAPPARAGAAPDEPDDD